MSVTRSGRRSKRTCLHISGLQRPVCPQHPQKAKNKQTSLERHSSNMTAFDYLFASSNCLKTSYLHHLLAHHLSIQRPPEIKTEEKQRTKGQSNTNNLIQPELHQLKFTRKNEEFTSQCSGATTAGRSPQCAPCRDAPQSRRARRHPAKPNDNAQRGQEKTKNKRKLKTKA